MEPSDMNHAAPEEQIDSWLRAHTQPDLPDNGFTLRVLEALPPKQRSLFAQRRTWLIVAGFAAGGFVAWRQGATSIDWVAASRSLQNVMGDIVATTGSTSFSAVLILVLISLGVAYWQSIARLFRN